jgi:hypothetical protein
LTGVDYFKLIDYNNILIIDYNNIITQSINFIQKYFLLSFLPFLLHLLTLPLPLHEFLGYCHFAPSLFSICLHSVAEMSGQETASTLNPPGSIVLSLQSYPLIGKSSDILN